MLVILVLFSLGLTLFRQKNRANRNPYGGHSAFKPISLLLMGLVLVGCAAVPESDLPVSPNYVTTVEIQEEEDSLVPVPEEHVVQEEPVDAATETAIETVPGTTEIVIINQNIPNFSNADLTQTEVYHHNAPFDEEGRVGVADALIGVESMPSEQRGSISGITPTGWKQNKYPHVSAGWVFNRSHLIGHQLTGNDDPQNLMTGSRWFNMAMLEYENFVAHYIEQTENHVRYRITPVFEGTNALASGIYMEGFSIEDNGTGLQFHIFVPNTQPGVAFDYATGANWATEGASNETITGEGPTTPESVPKDASESVSYKNCDAVRAAGRAPIRVGEPGYSRSLDRDGDGVGCE